MTNEELNIDIWKSLILICLDLNDWTIDTLPIDDKQVSYPVDIDFCDKFFIGINYDSETKTGTIYYARELTEEDVLHELLHVKYPKTHKLCEHMIYEKYENWIQEQTLILLNN